MIRHLLYHITPIGNWRENVAELQKRLHLFKGEKIITIAKDTARDSKFTSIEDVVFAVCNNEKGKVQFADKINFFPVLNSAVLREVPAFAKLLEELWARIKDTDNIENEIVFFGHTKGVTHHPESQAFKLWMLGLYHYNLDNIEEVERQLSWFSCTGAFKRYDPEDARPIFPPGSNRWHYSGSFFWFRPADVFESDWRSALKLHKYGVEAFLSFLFEPSEAGCLFADGAPKMDVLENATALLGDLIPPKKISVVVTAHGEARELELMFQCLELQREYREGLTPKTGRKYLYAAGRFSKLPTEVIVASDGKFLGAHEGADLRFDSPESPILIECPPEGGVGHHTRGPGIEKATGDFVVLTNMDNYFLPAWRYRLEQHLKDGVGFVYWNGINNLWKLQARKSELARGGIDLSFAAVRTDIAKEIGFPYRNYTGDFDYLNNCQKLARKKGLAVVHIDEVLSVHN